MATDTNLVLPEALNDLRSSAEQLNSITGAVSEVVREIERFLAEECHVGVSAYVPVGVWEGNSSDFSLGYDKVSSAWRVIVRDDDTDYSRAWHDCPRQLKLWSVQALPTLIKALESAVDETIDGAERTLADLAMFTSSKMRRTK